MKRAAGESKSSDGGAAKRLAGDGWLSPARKLDTDTDDQRIEGYKPLLPPACLLEELPLSADTEYFVPSSRRAVQAILTGIDDRVVVIVGPCSIHDVKAAKEYAESLKKLADELKDDLLVVMRVYFEKPRTTVGWKGLINDPRLDGSFRINEGLRLGRRLLLDINEMGLPVGCEFLDNISPQYTADLVAWGAIGARTTESQIHREMVSGLSMPVGFKNGTGGDCQVAVDGMISASNPHRFLGVTKQGLAAICATKGNKFCHVILRGGSDGPNYEAEHVAKATALLEKKKQSSKLMIDASHGNSKKIHSNQPIVCADIGKQLAAGSAAIFGVMIESHINEGNQKLSPGTTDPATLEYGKSVTDACINLETTAQVLRDLASSVRLRREAAKPMATE